MGSSFQVEQHCVKCVGTSGHAACQSPVGGTRVPTYEVVPAAPNGTTEHHKARDGEPLKHVRSTNPTSEPSPGLGVGRSGERTGTGTEGRKAPGKQEVTRTPTFHLC